MKIKILFAVIIIVFITIIAIVIKEPWLTIAYNIVIAFFPNEIKNFFKKIISSKQLRLSYSYIFKIELSGSYLLVKDEQGRNNFHPVGGVYKYNPDEIDLGERFDGEYDRVFDSTSDTKNDLRIVIKKKKLKDFNKWFYTGTNRENFDDLSREFTEELINRNILPEDIFQTVKYKYVGSYIEKSYNENLKMKQIRHFDILSIKLTNAQRTCLETINNSPSDKYVFANKDHIKRGFVDFGGKRYDIADFTKIIINATDVKLKEESDKNIEYSFRLKINQP